jgi:predicted ATPase
MPKTESSGIQEITVKNYKSILNGNIEIRPITILAGSNSSGKSSMIQPLLLLKQTLETPEQQSGMLLSGANVSLTGCEQIRSKIHNASEQLQIGIKTKYLNLTSTFTPIDHFLTLIESSFEYTHNKLQFDVTEDMADSDIRKIMERCYQQFQLGSIPDGVLFKLTQDHCFFNITPYQQPSNNLFLMSAYRPASSINTEIMRIIHIPGLRNEAHARSHWRAPISQSSNKDETYYLFAGTFPTYLASLIEMWKNKNNGQYEQLTQYVCEIGLTPKISTRKINDSYLEIVVGWDPSKPDPDETDMVNIADVGIGVSQVLPILAALIVANPGQIVYIEQSAVHLHPKSLIALSKVIVDAAKRGIKVIVETHSALLLLAVQVAIASNQKSDFASSDTILYWFTKDANGATQITKGEMDKNGAYGDWPEDFSAITLQLQYDYMDAIRQKMSSNKIKDKK